MPHPTSEVRILPSDRPHPGLWLAILLLLGAAWPLVALDEPLELRGCRGTDLITVSSGGIAEGLPHWDPVDRLLRDRVRVASAAGAEVRPLLVDVDEGVTARLVGTRPPLALRSPLQLAPPQEFELLVRGEAAAGATMELAFADGCGRTAPLVHLPVGATPEGDEGLLPGAEALANEIGDNGELRLLRYDHLWPKAFVGSASGWFWVGNRFPLGYPVEVLEVQFVTSTQGGGAPFDLMIMHQDEVINAPPSLANVVHLESGVVPSGEPGIQIVHVPMVEDGILLKGGTLWVALRNREGRSMHLAVGAGFDHIGNGFLSTTNGEDFHAFGLEGPGDGRPMIRVLVHPMPDADGPGLPDRPLTLGFPRR